jgi:hypothetical protein
MVVLCSSTEDETNCLVKSYREIVEKVLVLAGDEKQGELEEYCRTKSVAMKFLLELPSTLPAKIHFDKLVSGIKL